MDIVLNEAIAAATIDKGHRRSWSRAQKRRILREAFQPGASVADVARRHGLNANQLFNWRRTILARSSAAKKATPSLEVAVPDEMSAASADFMPFGVVVQTDRSATSLSLPPALSVTSAAASEQASLGRQAMDERHGMIEIDLASGTRLRVDAFVNERALRRVLSVLKAVS